MNVIHLDKPLWMLRRSELESLNRDSVQLVMLESRERILMGTSILTLRKESQVSILTLKIFRFPYIASPTRRTMHPRKLQTLPMLRCPPTGFLG